MPASQKRIGSACLLIAILSVIPAEALCQEVLLLRGANTLDQGEILLWESVFFAPLSEKYDFQKEDFVDLEGDNYKLTSYTMLGFGVLDNLELLIQVPVLKNVSTQEGETSSSAGIGDVSLQTRLMLADGSGRCPAINIGTMLRFPTGNWRDGPALGDGTIDLAFSTVITKKIGFFIGHVKLGYIFNGADSDTVNVGDKFLYMLKGDFVVLRGDYPLMKELALMIGLCGDFNFEDIDANGEHVDNSRQYRPLNISPMIRWTPIKKFFIRPRVVIPIKPLASGGKIYTVQYVLDLKYSF
jgi:hypothetical protein